ncbi:MAG: TIGR02147 family protein [Fibrobacter sp.]|nr:TIGR02147 family protein [Fibrobacter sp.]
MKYGIDIYHFTHFRKYLEEYQAARALEEPSFTRVEICNQLGLPKTRSYFADVLRGKKVSKRMAEKFEEVLELDKKECQYFEAMVDFDQAKTMAERTEAMNALLKLHPNPQLILNSDAYEYYKCWYNSTLFAILDVMDVDDDLTAVQKRLVPHVTLGKLEDSVKLLERLKLIRKNENGFWKPTRESISSGPYNNDELIREYQLQSFELSKQAVLSPSKNPNVMSTMVFSVSDKAYRELENELQKFKTVARRIIAKDAQKATRVYQMNLHLFSNLEPEGKDE